MQVRSLSPYGQAAPPLARCLPALVTAAGTPDFDRKLVLASHDDLGCEHITAFLLRRDGSVGLVLAADFGRTGSASRAADCYVGGHWRHDPANRVSVAAGSIVAVRLSATEIEEASYRRDCYTAPNLLDRFSVLQRSEGGIIRLNFYRPWDGGRFSDRQLDAVGQLSAILLSLLQRHVTAARRPAIASREEFETRLLAVAPKLPLRERQVCGGIARGLSSEAVALEVGISINTVLTYRKRAYARLQISSQNELLHLVLRG